MAGRSAVYSSDCRSLGGRCKAHRHRHPHALRLTSLPVFRSILEIRGRHRQSHRANGGTRIHPTKPRIHRRLLWRAPTPRRLWEQVGLPNDANIPRTFLNQTSGGGEGSLTGTDNWYRLHFKVATKYASQKFMLALEGAHTGVQVYFNGTLIPGISEVAADSQATHVNGFIPVIVELPVVADGATDNVIAIYVTRNNSKFFESIGWCEVFRFGQAMAGLFRNVYVCMSPIRFIFL